MIIYLKHMGKYTHNQLKRKSFEEIQKLYKKEQQWIDDFVPMDSEEGGKKRQRADPDDENVKRQKIGEALGSCEEQSELAKIEKDLSEEELQELLVVVPVEEVYVEALQRFDRDDLVKLWDLVKERFSTTEPTEDKEKELILRFKLETLSRRFFSKLNLPDHRSSLKISRLSRQSCQGRLLASFLDDAKYEHVGQDTRSQDGKDVNVIQGKDLRSWN
ncbi:hypothetical protein Tco_0286104 [Tanacetum coccineum]